MQCSKDDKGERRGGALTMTKGFAMKKRFQKFDPDDAYPYRQHQNMMIICVAYSDDPRLVRAALSTNGR